MTIHTVTIIGMGQIGSSLGAAIIQHGLARRVVGISRTEATARRALERGAADETRTSSWDEAVRESDLTVLATPVRHILITLPQIAPWVKPSACVMDVGSTKREIVTAALNAQPPFNFIGGHPMAGTEKSGPEACDPDLFRNRPFILIPARLNLPEWLGEIEALVRAMGAKPVLMNSAEEHDLAVALVSHVPYLFSYALTLATQESSKDFHAPDPVSAGERTRRGEDFPQSVAGNSYRDATRVAASDPDMVLDFLLTNRETIPRMLDQVIVQLEKLQSALLSSQEYDLRALLEQARRFRQRMN